MSGLFIHKEPQGAYRRFAPLGDAETFDISDPVQLVSQQLSDCPDDGDELHNNEVIGFACEPAEGIHAASRTGAANGLGAAENDMRSYIPWDAPGLELMTRNFWTTAAAGTQAAKPGTIIGTDLTLTGQNGTNVWGVENTAPTLTAGDTMAAGDDCIVTIVAVLNDDGEAIDADDTAVAAGEGWVVFIPRGPSQAEYGGA